MKKWFWSHKWLLVILISAIILRLSRLTELFYYTFDEQIFSFVSKRILVDKKLFLIGNITPLGVHLPPYFFYFSALPMWLSKLNPLGWGIWAAFWTTIAVFMIYLVGKEMFNQRVGLIASFFQAVSGFVVFYDRHYWPLTLNPLFALLTIWCLWWIRKGRTNYVYFARNKLVYFARNKLVYLLVLNLLLAISSDPSNISLVVYTALIWFVYGLVKGGKVIKTLILFSTLSIAPLLLFELRHNFYNTRGLLSFLGTKGAESGFSIIKSVESVLLLLQTFSLSFFNTAGRDLAKLHSFCFTYRDQRLFSVPTVFLFLSLVVIITFLWLTIRDKKDFAKRYISLFLLTVVGMLIFYAGVFKPDLYEQYLSSLFPIYFIIGAVILDLLWQYRFKLMVCLFLMIFLSFNIFTFINTKNSLGFSKKIKAAQFALQHIDRDKPFFLDSVGSCFAYQGYRFIFYLLGNEPVWSYVDKDMSWLYGSAPADVKPKQGIVFSFLDLNDSPEFLAKYHDYKENSLANYREGNLEVMVVK